MKAKLITMIVASLLVAACPSPLRGEDVVITIRLVNGKNGKSITEENLNVFRNGSHFAEIFPADPNGLIKLTIDRNAVVEFASNIQVTCSPYSGKYDGSQHLPQQYRVSEILEQGRSNQNMCSRKVRLEPRRGEFIFFERPRTLWEWMAL